MGLDITKSQSIPTGRLRSASLPTYTSKDPQDSDEQNRVSKVAQVAIDEGLGTPSPVGSFLDKRSASSLSQDSGHGSSISSLPPSPSPDDGSLSTYSVRSSESDDGFMPLSFSSANIDKERTPADLSTLQRLLLQSRNIEENAGGREGLELRHWHILEVLSKTLAYTFPKFNDEFHIPWTNNASGEPIDTKYTCKVVNLHHGVPLFILVPEDKSLPSLFIFRGTDRSTSLESLYGNFGSKAVRKDIGSAVFDASEDKIKTYLTFYGSADERPLPILVGHSQGASLARLTGVRHYTLVGQTVMVNAPKASIDCKEEYDAITDAAKDSKFITFNPDGEKDIVTTSGSAEFGTQFFTSVEGDNISAVGYHVNGLLKSSNITLSQREAVPVDTSPFAKMRRGAVKVMKFVLSWIMELIYLVNQGIQHFSSYVFDKDYSYTQSITADRKFKKRYGMSFDDMIKDIESKADMPSATKITEIEAVTKEYAELFWPGHLYKTVHEIEEEEREKELELARSSRKQPSPSQSFQHPKKSRWDDDERYSVASFDPFAADLPGAFY